jgi:putative copper export protein
MNYVDIVLRWSHILGGILLAGGLYYQWWVRPRGSDEDRNLYQSWQDRTRRRWSVVVMLATLLLLISGLANTALISIGYRLPGYYHLLLGIKLLLALVVFFLAAALAGRSALAQRLRADSGRWLSILALLNLLIIGLAGVMKFAERLPKE